MGQVTQSQGRGAESRASHTQAEEVDGTIVQEVADVPDVFGHGAEGVCTAGHKGIHAAGAHVHEKRPGVVVILDICHIQSGHKPPREEPGTQCDPLNPRGSLYTLHLTIFCLLVPADGPSLRVLTLVKCHGRVSGVLFRLGIGKRGKKTAFCPVPSSCLW